MIFKLIWLTIILIFSLAFGYSKPQEPELNEIERFTRTYNLKPDSLRSGNLTLKLRNEIEAKLRELYDESKCLGCEMLIGLSKLMIRSETFFKELFELICSLFKIEEKSICDDVANLMIPSLRYILMNTDLSAKEICSITFEECFPKVSQTLSKSWPKLITDEKNFNRKPLKQKSSNLLKALWLSDVHLDPEYAPSTPGECGEPLCCRKTSKGTDKSPLVGKYGFLGSCDIPICTFCNFSSHMNQYSKSYDYIIFTGDISPHDIWATTRNGTLRNAKRFAGLVKKLSNSDVFIPAIGNHETSPVNLFTPPEVKNELAISWLYEGLLDVYKQWIPIESHSTFLKGGYYYRDLTEKIRVLVLNTNYCQRLNFWLWYKHGDVADQLKWLSEQLEIAEKIGKSVHIIAHVAPDNDQCDSVWLSKYIKIIERYQTTIAAQLYGHTHFDEFRLFYGKKSDKKPFGLGLIGGSFTTFEAVNPSYKIVYVGDNGEINDVTTYFADLSTFNQNSTLPLKWIKSYSTLDEYNLPNMKASTYGEFLETLKSNETVFNQFYMNYHRKSNAPQWTKPCVDSCRETLLNAQAVYDPIA